MTTRAGALLSIVGLTSAATAQLPSFDYHIDAPTSMTPGQTATITVLCGFSPGVGGLVVTPFGLYPVLGLSSGGFNLAATGGQWSLGPPPVGSLIFPYNFISCTHGTAAGSNVTGVVWGNGFAPPFNQVSTLNPTPIWNATFTAPATPAPVTISILPVAQHGVWVMQPNLAIEILNSNTTGAQVVIQVIPTPASSAILGAGLLTAARRRRRRA